MKSLITFAFLLGATASVTWGQQFMTRAAHIEFFSDTPAEDIFAETDQASAVLDLANFQVAFQVPIISFHFEKALMEEHFNENYMETEKFPAATFQGSVQGLKVDAPIGESVGVSAEGTLTVHGVAVERTIEGTAKRTKTGWVIDAAFEVPTEAHDIPIPGLVREKIAEQIDVKLHAELEPR